MAGKNKFTLNVINQEAIIYYGDCEVLFVPSDKETVAIMAYHTPMIMKLGEGRISIRENRKTKHIADVKSGIVYVAENSVTVLVN